MKKMFNLMLGFFLALPTMLFASSSGGGGGSPLSKISTQVNTQIESASTDIASVVNTVSGTLGFIWLVIMLLMYFFAPEQLKQNMKLFVGAAIILGVVYGISAAI